MLHSRCGEKTRKRNAMSQIRNRGAMTLLEGGEGPDLESARIFAVVARLGNVRAAATHLGMSQSTVSRRITAMEESFGAKLFVRSSEGVSLTDVGRSVMQITSGLESTANRLRTVSGSVKRETVVTISGSDGIGGYWIPICLAGFAEEHPGITVHVRCDDYGRSADMARAEADIDVTYRLPTDGDSCVIGHGTMPFQLFASRSYAERNGLPGTLEELIEHRVVALDAYFMRGAGDGDWNAFADLLARHPWIPYRVNSSLALGFAIRSGWGIGPQPTMVEQTEHSMVPLPKSVYSSSLRFWLVMHRDTKDNPAPRAIAEWIKQRFIRGASGLGEFKISDDWS